MSKNDIPKPTFGLNKMLSDSIGKTKESIPSYIDRQYQFANQYGFARPNKFLVLIFPNLLVRRKTGMRDIPDIARLATTCKSINLNEQSWFTTEQTDIHAGATRVFPYKKNVNNSNGIRLQFNCGSDMFEREFFQYWMDFIQDPASKRWNFYDDYAVGSDLFLINIPNHIANFSQAINELFTTEKFSTLSGVRFTEVYPYALNINGGALSYQQSQEPLYVDVGLMYHEMVPLTAKKIVPQEELNPVTETGFPIINSDWAKRIIENSRHGLNQAVDGFVLNAQNSINRFKENERDRGELSSQQRSILESYAIELGKESQIPRAMNGIVKQPSPGNGALDLALTTISQVQGFFGAGFYGNGWYPP
jgi:hypothetical protein